jgi:hypothetical protein
MTPPQRALFALLLLALIVSQNVSAAFPTFNLSSSINGVGTVYKSNRTIDFCSVYNSITFNISKLSPCPVYLEINETFSQQVAEKVSVINGSVLNGSGTVSLLLNTSVPSSAANLQYILIYGTKRTRPFSPESPSALKLGYNQINGVSIPATVILGGLFSDLSDLLISSGYLSDFASSAISELLKAVSFSGTLNSIASINEQVSGAGLIQSQNLSFSSETPQPINLSLEPSTDTETLMLTPTLKQNLTFGININLFSISGSIFSVPVHTISNFSAAKASQPMTLSWYKVTLVSNGNGYISPSVGTRWYLQDYVIHLNATSYTTNGFIEYIITDGSGTHAYNQSQLLDYQVTSPAQILVEFSGAQQSVPWLEIAAVVIIVLVILAILSALRRRRTYYG